MTPPRRRSVGLRTMLVGVALVSVPLGWVAYQLNWIRERHRAAQAAEWALWSDPNAAPNDPFPPAPLPLSLFGERGAIALSFRKLPGESQSQLRDRLNWYRQLFPEADVDYAEIVPFKVIN